MKQYVLKRENNDGLLTGMFETEQQAWNVMCVKTARKFLTNELAFLYDENNNLVKAGNHSIPCTIKIKYTMVILPGIYSHKKYFDKDIPIESIWEEMRLEAIRVEESSSYHAKLLRDDKVVLEDKLSKSFLIEEPEEDLLTAISKFRI